MTTVNRRVKGKASIPVLLTDREHRLSGGVETKNANDQFSYYLRLRPNEREGKRRKPQCGLVLSTINGC